MTYAARAPLTPLPVCVPVVFASAPDEPTPWGGSGGGFSWTFKQPEYQAAAVNAYLKDNAASLPPPDAFAAANRAYPGTLHVSGVHV